MFWHKHEQRGPRGPHRQRGPHTQEETFESQMQNEQDGPHEHQEGPEYNERGRWHWFAPHGGGRPERPFRHGGPGGGRPPFDEEGGGRRRHRRGDIKFALLELLAEQPRHGYDLIKALEQRYGGFYRPSPGSVYPTLQLLEDEGHLTSNTTDGKRTYHITESGKKLLIERPNRDEHWQAPGGRQRHMHELRPELDTLRTNTEALLASIAQVAQHGTSDQAQAVAALLESNRRAIYRILAGDSENNL